MTKAIDRRDFLRMGSAALAAQWTLVVLCPEPTVIAGQAFTTGVIERKSFEHVLPNTYVDYSMKFSGIDKVHAILGGFRLFPADDDYLRQTVAEIKAINPDVLIPMHCSGPGLIAALRNSMPDQLVPSTTGTEYVFGV